MNVQDIPNGTEVTGVNRQGETVKGRIFSDRFHCRIADHVMVSVTHKAARGGSIVGMNVAVRADSVKVVVE